MSGGQPAIIIAVERGDWPGGPTALRPRRATREPNGALWFGADSPGADRHGCERRRLVVSGVSISVP